MKRVVLMLIMQNFAITYAQKQTFTIQDFMGLSKLPAGRIDNYMFENGFTIATEKTPTNKTFTQKIKIGKTESLKIVDWYQQNDVKYFVLKTRSFYEMEDIRKALMKDGFFFNKNDNIGQDSLMLFQKANMSIGSITEETDSNTLFTFTLKTKKIPDTVIYAEDLLQFDSREFLISYFGEKNITSDFYYAPDKEAKKCSVLYSGTPYQAIFVWDDGDNLNKLSCVVVSNTLPAKGGTEKSKIQGNIAWKFHSGVQWGMPLRDMLRLNETNFNMYVSKSDFAFLVKPEITGKINFKKTEVKFDCKDCSGNEIFNRDEVSASDVAKANLPLKIFDILMYP